MQGGTSPGVRRSLAACAAAVCVLLPGCMQHGRPLFEAEEVADLTREGQHRTREARLDTLGGDDVSGEWGEILVPENRRVAGSRLLRLRFRRTGPAGAPAVFYFTGGPGVSNLGQRFPAELLRHRAVVEVGYRGMDSSTRLECRALRRVLTPDDLAAPASRAGVARAFEECLDGWRAAGIDPAGYQLADLIEDAEDVRRALGLETVDLMASSYGTRIALHYASIYPSSIRRLLLLGANPPGHFFWSAEDVRRGFEAYQPYFEREYPQYAGKLTVEELFVQVLDGLPRRDLLVHLDAERIRTVTFVMLFHRGTAELVLDAYLRAYEDGNHHGLAVLSAAHDVVVPGAFEWGDFFLKGLVDLDPLRDHAAEAAGGRGRFGSPLGALLFAPRYAPETLAFRDPPLPLNVSRPTLILSGELDFSTPDRTAREELADRFPESVRQLTVPALGHVGDFWGQGDALGAVATQFLVHGEVADPVPFRSPPVRFRRGVGLSHAPFVIAAGVAGGVIALLRR